MDAEESDSTALTSRSRHHSTNKMKVLVRSHAMREESPPPSQHDSPPHHKQPCIKLIPSPEPGGGAPDGGGGGGGSVSPVVVLSPSPSPGVLTQQQQQCLSPAGTLVPSSPASRGSPNGHLHSAGVEEHTGDESEMSNTKYANNTATKLPPMTNNNRYHHNQHYNHHYHQQYQQPPPPFPPKQSSQPTNYRGAPSVGGGTRKPGVPSHNGCDNNNTTTAVNNNNNNISGSGNNMLTVQRARGKLRQQSSSQGSFESSYNSPCLSRDSSSEQYTDTTGIDLEQFIPETLNRNSKDRALMLRIEQELVNLAKDRCKTHYKFPPMSSYQRMLVHRCAAYFGMDHNIESSGGKSVIVNKTKNTRIPETEFKELIREDIVFANDEPRRSILKRDSNSIEDYRSCSSENRRSKSFEEREEEYEKARRRIFNREHMHDGSSEDFGWSEMPWSSTESEYSSRFRLQPPDCHRRHFGKLIKVHSEDTAETLRPYVAKSYSFGGYGGSISVLSRGDSVMSTHSAGPRLLTKQDSAASSVSWRLSPSSSGYKSQSQMSESVTPSPTSTPHQGAAPQSGCGAGPLQEQPIEGEEVPPVMRKCEHVDTHIVWAVTDIQNVPLGSIIIDPETGKPLKNDDGTIYHYDPNNLPPSLVQPPSKSETPPPPPPQPPPKQSPKENPTPSPKKNRQTKSSPTRKSTVTNSIISSSTSPSLPFTPPPQQLPPQVTMPPPLQRSFSYTDQQQQQQFAGGGYTAYAPLENGMYAQSYLVYAPAPYGMHMAAQYDTRMEATPGLPTDMTTFYVQDSSNGAPPPPQAYQPGPTQSYWNHQPMTCFYQNGQPSATTAQMVAPPSAAQQQPRFAGHPQTGFLPSSAGTYPTSYVSPPSAAQQAAAAQQQTPELVPVYPSHQPMQVVYHQNHQHPTAIYPQSQPQVIYTTSQPTAAPPIYPSPGPPVPTSGAHVSVVPTAMAPPYPQGTPTPNTQSQQDAAVAAAYAQLAHGMQQMSIAGGAGHYQHAAAMMMQQQQHGKGAQMEYRPRPPSQQHFSTTKLPSNGKFLSRQSSVGNGGSSGGTNSPAATVVAIPPPAAISGYYKTPPDTPPAQGMLPPHFAGFVPPHPGAGMFGMAPGQPPPVLYKQMGNIRISTPGTARSSRSPTPASDISHLERQRMSFPPPNIFQGMPYVVPSDPRLIPTRSQPNVYKQAPSMNKQNFNQGPDNRPHKNKKNNRGNKQPGLPPSGK